MITVSDQAVDAGPDQEMGSSFLDRAEKLVDVAFAITDVNASRWVTEKLRGLLNIFQPSDAFFLFDGNACGLICFLSAAVPLNFFRVQNLSAANPSGKPSIVTARLECIRMPQTVCDLRRPALSRPLLMLLVIPIATVLSL